MNANQRGIKASWGGDRLPIAKCHPPKKNETVFIPRGRTNFFTMVNKTSKGQR